MVRLGLYIWFYYGLLSSSTIDANKLIVERGEAKPINGGVKERDFFYYTDESSCGNVNNVSPWCKGRNAENLKAPYKCSCQCQWNSITFLLDERRCVNESYLMSRFGIGKFSPFPPINLTVNNHLDTSIRCRNCQVATVEYHQANNMWKNMNSSSWIISNNGRLRWQKYTVDEVNGKIIRIQFNCSQQRGNRHCSVLPQTLFCKSKGKTIVNITAVNPIATESILISPTVTPTSTTSAAISPTVTPTLTTSAAISPTVTPTLTTSAAISPTVTPISTTSAAISPTVTPTLTTSAAISPTVTPTLTTSAAISPTVTPTSTAIPTTYASQPPKEDRHKTDEADSPTGAIAGAVIACIMVIIVVIFFIIWKRRRKTSRPRKSTKVATDSTGNPMYLHNQGETIVIPCRKVNGSNVMGNEEYDYASIGGPSDHQKPSIPLYESLVKDNIRDSVYAPLSKEGLDSTPVEYSYNHLQHPQYNPPRSKSDPLYNTLQPPNNDKYMEPETRISDNQPEPVYNVLEGPDANSAPQDNDPVYNVLEDPNASQYPQDNDPVYNILEDPDDDYDNAQLDDDNLPASGQDNVAYSSTIDLRNAQSPSSPDYDVLEGPESALQDSTYQPLGVRVQDDMYQPLDRTSQPIYHSLEPNDSMA